VKAGVKEEGVKEEGRRAGRQAGRQPCTPTKKQAQAAAPPAAADMRVCSRFFSPKSSVRPKLRTDLPESLMAQRVKCCASGIVVQPGPSFNDTGFGSQADSDDEGITVQPGKEDFVEWAHSCLALGHHACMVDPLQGWSPTRSVIVRWRKTGSTFYYPNEPWCSALVRKEVGGKKKQPAVFATMKRFVKVAAAQLNAHGIPKPDRRAELRGLLARELAFARPRLSLSATIQLQQLAYNQP
jgi:hypothetical protein